MVLGCGVCGVELWYWLWCLIVVLVVVFGCGVGLWCLVVVLVVVFGWGERRLVPLFWEVVSSKW